MSEFNWDSHNLRKIKAHNLTQVEVEETITQDPLLVYEQQMEQELRFLYYGETSSGRVLAIVLTERDDLI